MKLIKLNKKYEGKFLTYYVADYLTKNEHIKSYELISRDKDLTIEKFGNNKPAGVGMVALSQDKEKIVLQKEFRLSCNKWIYNFPAGLIDKGETPLEAAKRELKEETGLDVVEILDVLSPAYTSPGISDETMTVVILTCKGDIVDSTFEEEEIHARWYTKQEILELLKTEASMSVRTQMVLYQWAHK